MLREVCVKARQYVGNMQKICGTICGTKKTENVQFFKFF